MGVVLEFILGILGEIFVELFFYGLIKGTGTIVRWVAFGCKNTILETYEQEYNSRVGILTWVIIIGSIYLLIKHFQI